MLISKRWGNVNMKLNEVLKNEVSGWKVLEVLWLLLACGVIIGLSIYWNDSLMGIICYYFI